MQALLEKIQQAKRIALTSHVHPDGDAVGSVLGLHLILEQHGKEVASFLVDGVPKVFHFLEGEERVQQAPIAAEYDLCIVLDAPDMVRSGALATVKTYAKNHQLAFIDHHPVGDLSKQTQASLHDTSAAATCQLVYQLAVALNARITPSIATALLTGMYTDTGGFQYENTTTEALECAAELMKRGGRLNKIVENIAHHKSMASLKLLGLAMERLHITNNGHLAVSVLTHTDLRRFEATSEDLSGIVGSLNVLPGVAVTLLLTEVDPGQVRGSFRTSDGYMVNVSRMAALLGGGGHPRAAGFTVPGKLVGSQNHGWRIEPNLVS